MIVRALLAWRDFLSMIPNNWHAFSISHSINMQFARSQHVSTKECLCTILSVYYVLIVCFCALFFCVVWIWGAKCFLFCLSFELFMSMTLSYFWLCSSLYESFERLSIIPKKREFISYVSQVTEIYKCLNAGKN